MSEKSTADLFDKITNNLEIISNRMPVLFYFAGETIRRKMAKSLLKIWVLLFSLALVKMSGQETVQGGCDIIFSLGDNDTLCTNSEIFPVPDAFPFGGVYSGPGVADYSFDPSITGVGQFEITYTYTDENCTSSATVIMTVIEGSDLELVGDFVICEGEGTTIASGDGQEYTWADGSKSTFKEFTPSETIITTASGIDINGCNVTTEFQITVGTVPDAFVTGETMLCLGDTAHLTVEGATNWQWSTGSTDQTIDVIISSPETIELTIFGDNCDSTIAVYVSVLPYPNVVVSAPSNVCAGDTVVVEAFGAVSYKSFLGDFDSTFSFEATIDFTFTVQGFNDNGCSSTTDVTVFVGENTLIALSEVGELCLGESQTLSANGTDGFLWENLDNSTIISEGPINQLEFGPLETTNYRVTGVNELGCGESIDFTVVVHPIPELSVSAADAICFGKLATLMAEGATEYLWNENIGGNPYSFTADTSGVISVLGISEFGCESMIFYDLIVNPVPIAGITGSPAICEGQSATLIANGAMTYEWSTGDLTSEVVVFPVEDSLFIVTATNEFGCSDFTTYTVLVRPSPVVNLIGPDTICSGQLFHLGVETNGNYLWSDGSSGAFIEFIASNDSTVYVASEGANGCVNTQYFTIVVNALPDLLVSGENEICAQETVTLTASGGVNYQWGNGSQEEFIEVTPIITSNYYLYGTGENGCVGEIVFPLIVHQLPYVSFLFSQDSICDLGPAITWQANPAGGVYSGDGVANNQFDPFIAIVGMNETSYTVTDANNCAATSSDFLYVDDCTAIEENSNVPVSIYPNPADHEIFIESAEGRISGIMLFNGIGEIVADQKSKQEASRVSLNVSDLNSGIYELRFQTTDGQIVSRKIIIQ